MQMTCHKPPRHIHVSDVYFALIFQCHTWHDFIKVFSIFGPCWNDSQVNWRTRLAKKLWEKKNGCEMQYSSPPRHSPRKARGTRRWKRRKRQTPYWCTVLVQYGRRKSTKTSGAFSLFLYQRRFLFTRELAYVRINISSSTSSGYTAENQEERLFSARQHSYFGVTHRENSEVQIAVFSKWNMLRKWKLVQRFTFCLSST